MPDGRVKTLHPAVHGGILAIRNNEKHMKTLENLNIDTIDLVVINLYPFKETILRNRDEGQIPYIHQRACPFVPRRM